MTSTRQVAPNMALDAAIAARQAAGESIIHLGFGEARLPVLPQLQEVLRQASARSGYGPVVGQPETLDAVAGYWSRRGMPTDGEQVMVAPGSKALIWGTLASLPGDVVLAAPCWNTYPPQVRLAGKTPIRVPIPAECGGVPDPELLDAALHDARTHGLDPRVLLLTTADNPTGTLCPPSVVRDLCTIAADHELVVLSDEIYRDCVHPGAPSFLSPAEVLPEDTIVFTGLSKSLALGGWRIGAARFPTSSRLAGVREQVAAIASETWSTLAQPMQGVATYAFAEPAPIRRFMQASARLHGAVAQAVHEIMLQAGFECRPPSAGFYVYPDGEPLRARLAARGVADGASLQDALLERCGIAVLSGHHQGDHPDSLRFRAATSLLYGTTDEERQASLTMAENGTPEDILALLHLRDTLSDLRERLGNLLR